MAEHKKAHHFVKLWSLTCAIICAVVVSGLATSTWGRGVDNSLARSVEFKVREQLGKSPALDPRIKIYNFDDKAVTRLQRTSFYIDEWADILVTIDQSKPAAIVIDKFFSILSDPHGKSAESIAKIKGVEAPIYIGSFVAPAKIPFRDPLNLEREEFKLNPDLNLTHSMLGQFPTGPSAAFKGVFDRIGHILYNGDARVRPFIRIGEASVLPHIATHITPVRFENGKAFINGAEMPINQYGETILNMAPPAQYYPVMKRMLSIHAKAKKGKPLAKVEPGDYVLLLPGMYTGGTDFHQTPFGYAPGGLVLATMMNSILSGQWLQEVDQTWLWISVVCLIGGLVGSFAPPVLAAFLSILFAASIVGGSLWSFAEKSQVLPWIWMTGGFLSTAISSFAAKSKLEEWRHKQERAQKEQVKKAFSLYLSPEVIDDILVMPESLSLGGRNEELTCFFSDVRGFTTISETLSPEALSQFMNEYFTPMTNIILDSQGVLDKYIGDAIMAFWGAPLKLENNAASAADACNAMLLALDQLRKEFRAKSYPNIEVGMGLNTGPMVVGNMGSDRRFCYTVMGDSVNLAARLEGLTKQYGVACLMTASTADQLPTRFYKRTLDDIRVKGKNEPVTIYELMRPDQFNGNTQRIDDLIGSYELALTSYRQQDWETTKKHLDRCMAISPKDGPTALMLERIEEYQSASLPEDWDGVHTFQTK